MTSSASRATPISSRSASRRSRTTSSGQISPADEPRLRRRSRSPGDLARDRPAGARRLALLRSGRRDVRADRAELQVVRAGGRAVQPVRPELSASLLDEAGLGRRVGRDSRERRPEALVHPDEQRRVPADDRRDRPGDHSDARRRRDRDEARYPRGRRVLRRRRWRHRDAGRVELRVALVVAPRSSDLLPGVPEQGLERRSAGDRRGSEEVAGGSG